MPFRIPHILRCNVDENGVFPNDGFDVVYCGGVEVEDLCLEIFEWDRRDGQGLVWIIPYENISRVDATLFISSGENFVGGMVRIIGIFDRNVEERVTMQMPLDVYGDFVEAFNQHMHEAHMHEATTIN